MAEERQEHIGRLFEEALALPAKERTGFLHKACGCDDYLRAEVETRPAYDRLSDSAFHPDQSNAGTMDAGKNELQQDDVRCAEMLDLRFFAGLNVDDIAKALCMLLRTVNDDWASASAWLHRESAIRYDRGLELS